MSQQPIGAVIFDWAGTVIDFGSRAPIDAFIAAFASIDFDVTVAEAREPMGRAKRDHIATVLKLPSVVERWRSQGRVPAGDTVIDQIYEAFLPLQLEAARKRSDPIEGVVKVVSELRARKIKVGSSTGYTREIMDVVEPLARARGFAPDCVTTASDGCAGRPAPWMIYRNCEQLDVYPIKRVVKVDDTLVGIEAAINAGCWAIGVAGSGNLMGLDEEEYRSLDPTERDERLSEIEREFCEVGAHAVIPTVAELLPAIDAITTSDLDGGS